MKGLSKKQYRLIHASLARIYEKVGSQDDALSEKIFSAMRLVDRRVTDIEEVQE
uniref:Terminase n=1 Tax=viral metagenome TaxID=1070528 RepID=A0A6H1ZTV6_9ZZZZ